MNEPEPRAVPGAPAGGHEDVFATALESVTRKVAQSTRGMVLASGPFLEAITEEAAAAARGAVETGGDLIPAGKAIIMGVVRGSGATREAALTILFHASKVILRHTADRNGNVAAAIKGIILGAIASGRMMGVETLVAASTAAQGALAGASEAGDVTAQRVVGVLKEPIEGIRVVLPGLPKA